MKFSIRISLILISSCINQYINAFTLPLNNVRRTHYRSYNPSSLERINRKSPIITSYPTSLPKKSLSSSSFVLSAKNSDDDDQSNKESKPPLTKQIQITLQSLTTKLPNLKVVFFSFVAGCLITVAGVVIPFFSFSDEQIEQPVALFETILSDLDRGYVDQVNTNKLFETGVSAMLRSLDPYTEYFEQNQDIQETVSGRYGGVGLVISGATEDGLKRMNVDESLFDDEEDEEEDVRDAKNALIPPPKKINRGIRVVTAFEGYAYDYGMRVGDRLVAIDSKSLESKSVDDARNMLRGKPGTEVRIAFERDGVEERQEVVIPRRFVKIRDVKCAALLDDVGYVQLTGFSQDAGMEMRNAVFNLQGRALLNNGRELKGLILDLRNNPGGLLTSAVDVASLFLPNNSDIVSARGRNFPGILYRSKIDPILPPTTKLVVLTNSGTASAAEIVSGAIQDLDVGVILGGTKTFGKGLVQNVEALPFDKALKFTVAKYYTPSGRCIQSTNYKEGGGLKKDEAGFTSEKVKDRATFYTVNGREVKDGGGIEPDYKIQLPKSSILEVTLLRSGAFQDFAGEWSKTHTLTNTFTVSEDLYKEFIDFCLKKQRSNELQLEALYTPSINELNQVLKKSGYEETENALKALRASILKEIQSDFVTYKKDIKEDIGQNILARYLPESMLIEIGAKRDVQVKAALGLIADEGQFNKLLARDTTKAVKEEEGELAMKSVSLNTASRDEAEETVKVNLKW